MARNFGGDLAHRRQLHHPVDHFTGPVLALVRAMVMKIAPTWV